MFNRQKRGKVIIDGERISYIRKRPVPAAAKLVILLAVLVMFAFAGGAVWRFYSAFSATGEDITRDIGSTLGEDSPEYKELMEQGHFNMLVLGEDDVEGTRRSDTILFVTVELDDKCVKVLALPRDTRVYIPGHGNHKLNSAFAFGGPELLKTTIENYLHEPILYYVIVDYDNFPKLVDAFGGVTIDVKKKMRYVDRAGHLDINIDAGRQHLDGRTALHYVRFRKDSLGDIGRVQRQQQFIKALLKKAYSPEVIVRFPSIVANAMEVFKTNMPVRLATALAGFAKAEFKRENIYMSTLFGTAEIVDGLSYWIGNPESGKQFINATVEELRTGNSKLGEKGVSAGYTKGYSSANDEVVRSGSAASDRSEPAVKSREEMLKIVKDITQPVAVLNGSGEKGISQAVAQRLQELGVDVVYKGNAKHYDYMYSNVVYPIGADSRVAESASKLGELLNVPKNLVRQNNQAFYASIIIGHDHKDIIKLLDKINGTDNKQ